MICSFLTQVLSNIQVWCEMEIDGGGWTVIQRRGYGTGTRASAEKFNRLWREYKTGFGAPLGDYWLGNYLFFPSKHPSPPSKKSYFNPGLDSMIALGSRCSNEMEVVLTYFDDTTKTARYSNFSVGPESDNYRLHLAGFLTGNAGKFLILLLNNTRQK
jgi:hypothetical protein